MPKLICFLPCDKVIISQDQTVSFITMIEGIVLNLSPEEEAKLPDDAGAPREWHVFSVYEWEAADDPNKEYEQRVYLELPNGRIPTDISNPIVRETDKKRSRNLVRIIGLPIAPAGDFHLRLAIREVGQEDWREIADYTIVLSRA